MIPQLREDEFPTTEWLRLDGIASTMERELRRAYLMTVVQNRQTNSLIIRNVITDAVVETAVSSASAYGMVFNPEAPEWRRLIDALTDTYMGTVLNDESAKDQVKAILPSGLSLSERRDRLDTFGLDGRGAVRIERMRQDGTPNGVIAAERLALTTARGNLLALTEINRVVNATLETLWITNLQGIRKAAKKKHQKSEWFYERDGNATVITSLDGIPVRARKEIVTRKDNRVCQYCEPLDRTTAKLGHEFVTHYGLFMFPPFHPRCRCYMIVRI